MLMTNFVLNLFLVLLPVAVVTVLYFKRKFLYWKQRKIEFLPPAVPFGNASKLILQKRSLGQDLQMFYEELKPKGLKYAGYYFFAKPVFVAFDPELIKQIMVKDFQHFVNRSFYLNEEVDPLSGHLFSLKDARWKNLRAKLTPTFTSGKMRMMFGTLVKCSDELVVILDEAVKKREAIDIKDVLARFTTDIIGSCAFGLECNSLKNPDSDFRKYGKKVFELDAIEAFRNFLAFAAPGVLAFFRLPVNKKDVSEFMTDVVKETVKYREKNNVVRKDFLQLLIQLKNQGAVDEKNNEIRNGHSNGVEKIPQGDFMTIEELSAQVFVFFIAGYETSSTTLTFCFYELVTNPSVQEKLKKEVQNVLLKYDGKITYDAIMEMTYMDKCINETLRKYPPVPLLTRECNKDYKIMNSETVLKKGNLVLIPLLGIHRDPEFYPEPDVFDPERFSEENKSKRHPFTWLPFGEGPRVCIGLRFGLMQTKVALAVLLSKYKFELNAKTKSPLEIDPKSIIMATDKKVWLNAYSDC